MGIDANCGLDIGGVSTAPMTAGGGTTKPGGSGGGTIAGNGIVPARSGTVFTGNGGGRTVDEVKGGKGGLVSAGGGGGMSAGNGGGGISVVGGGGGGIFSFRGSILSSFTLSSLTMLASFFFSATCFTDDFVLFSEPLDNLASSNLLLDLLLLLGLGDLLNLLGLGDRLPLLGLGDRLLLLGGVEDRSLLCRNGEYLLFRRLVLLLGGLNGDRLENLLL